jgi:hypothetical protein
LGYTEVNQTRCETTVVYSFSGARKRTQCKVVSSIDWKICIHVFVSVLIIKDEEAARLENRLRPALVVSVTTYSVLRIKNAPDHADATDENLVYALSQSYSVISVAGKLDGSFLFGRSILFGAFSLLATEKSILCLNL